VAVDFRSGSESILQLLPNWILESIVTYLFFKDRDNLNCREHLTRNKDSEGYITYAFGPPKKKCNNNNNIHY